MPLPKEKARRRPTTHIPPPHTHTYPLYGSPAALIPLRPHIRHSNLNGEPSEVNAGADDAFIVIRIHANGVGLQVERVLAVLHLLQLVLVQIRPAPDPGVDHMGKAFSPGNLGKENMNKSLPTNYVYEAQLDDGSET